MPKTVNTERDCIIAALWNEPRSSNAIARELGITRGMVTSAVTRMRRQGVPLRRDMIPSQVALNAGVRP